MIYTVTLNPAMDVLLKLDQSCRIGKNNRAVDELVSPGGKGINVSRVLKVLKRDTIALGLVGGNIGKLIDEDLKKENIKTDFVWINGNTRVNIKIHRPGANFEETQVNAPGPNINRDDIINLAKKLAKIKKGDIVIISGGIPKTLSITLFDNFLKYISSRDAYVIVDLFGSPLLKVVRYKPFLVSLNEDELADTIYTQIKTEEDCIKGAKRLLKLGALNVIVMRGANGAIFINDDMTIKAKALKGEVKNPNGAGDSLLAGFVDEYLKTGSFDLALKKGIVMASASIFSSGLIDKNAIDEANKQIK